MTNEMILPVTATFVTAPRTVQALVLETLEMGGQVVRSKERRFEFLLPHRAVGGEVRLINRGAVGYFVRDGKNVIRGVASVRSEISYWARQSR